MTNQKSKINTIRHSLAHIMATAIQELYPKVKFGIGPAIDNGFYYDFDNLKISDKDLSKIEKKMQELIKKGLKFEKQSLSANEANKIFKNQPYKLELIKKLKKETKSKKFQVSSFKFHDFIDLCKGPHIKSSKEINLKAFKLTKLAGAYWRGDEKNQMLTRIYGLAFETEKELTTHLHNLAEAEKRDHRKLGTQLDLFSFHEEGPGFAFWHAKGLIIWQEIVKYWREIHKQNGYEEIATPLILNRKLWEKSGHWEHYKEDMYFCQIDEQDFAIKPMNCPGGVLVYKTKIHSYKEFPLRVAELGLVHRHELSGVLHGLSRVRSFTQDDAHIYCLPDQIEAEIKKVISLTNEVYKKFGFDNIKIELSTRPKNSMGSAAIWKKAETALKKVLKDEKIDYQLNEGDGAFYGPKIDFHIADAIGRTWQCGTIQLDFAMPETLDITYIDDKGKKKRPVMIHRTILGSLERFIGILIEHYAGALPFWLSPIQIAILPISSTHIDYANQILKTINEDGSRCFVDTDDNTIGKKIREAELQKIPYILVVGDKEIKNKTISVRERGKGDLGAMTLKNFIEKITNLADRPNL
jgi:threonyl-tRNA synthetase